jgi:hypothetical protein
MKAVRLRRGESLAAVRGTKKPRELSLSGFFANYMDAENTRPEIGSPGRT